MTTRRSTEDTATPDEGVEPPARRPLSRERILAIAVARADAQGIGAVTMRGVAEDLGVEAMSLYHHVANKDALLDGMADLVVDEVHAAVGARDLPDPAADWQASLRARILVAREVMVTHPWAPPVIETRTSISPAFAAWFDAVLGVLHAGGFSWDLAHHAMHALGSQALGFVQELFEPDDPDGADDETAAMMAQMATTFPNLVAMVASAQHEVADTTLGWCDDQYEFEFALDIILDGLEQRRATA